MSKSKQSLERLKEQREKLNARIQAQESRLRNTERKKDTRRKILIGSYFIDEAQKENKIDSLKTLMEVWPGSWLKGIKSHRASPATG